MFLVSLTLAAQGCAGNPVIVASSASCPSLVPSEWESGVEGAPVPAAAGPKPATFEGQLAQAIFELKAWVGFGVDESSRREQANGRYRDAMGIIRRCTERDAAAVKKARPKFLGFF
jgi:hypothetical protein